MTNPRRDFPIFDNTDIAYLDSAATTQKPQCVIDAERSFYERRNANIYRGAYTLSIEATEAYGAVRKKVADFLGGVPEDGVVFSKNASESLNLLAYSYGLYSLSEGDEVVISIAEHHSNLVPWQYVTKKTGSRLVYMYTDESYGLTPDEINKKITERTKIVAVTHVSNVTGTINDIKAIAKRAHEVGAVLIVDGTQSVPHMRVDLKELDADFFVFSGHKIYAPLGVGVLVGKPELLEAIPPFLMGGEMIEYVYEDRTTFAPIPMRFEAGTQNVGGVIGLGAALDYVSEIGFEAIEAHEGKLYDYALKRLSALPYVTIYASPDREKRTSVISFNINGVHPHDVASILDGCGVCVRAGNHCAQPFMRYLGVDSTCRASLGIYNNEDDINRLVAGVEKAYGLFEKYLTRS
ncbi:MAG: cysteine desulfurase [Clostridia bacterium]|nr:cysteine desulfurase [Clostridia bacterium]